MSSNSPFVQKPVIKVDPLMVKYNLVNSGETIATVNYRRPSNYSWAYQEQILPGQSKNIWAVPNTFDVPNFFKNDVVIEDETNFVSTSNCVSIVNNGLPSFEIFFSSAASIPPNIRIDYFEVDPSLSYCDQQGDWVTLNTLTPDLCPNVTSVGTIQSHYCSPGFYLRAVDTSNNKPVRFYIGTGNDTQNCSNPDQYPCNPNSFAQTTNFISSCAGCGFEIGRAHV